MATPPPPRTGARTGGLARTGSPAVSSRQAAAASGPLAAGQSFGPRYHVIKLLGAGGMGAVYQAWDEELGVALALKVIRPEVTDDPDAAREIERRFKRELLLARQVTHKNVVRIHDLGEIDGIKYITMPYVEGDDLASVLRREGKLPVPRALGLARQIIAGLQAAHEAGVVHRDLKPANIMVDHDDHAVIMDFGIARGTGTASGMTLATAPGSIVGTIEYMAPEQAKGQSTDHRADIYAFGLILTELLTGMRRHKAGESAVADLMGRMQQAPPPLRSVDPALPETVERIVSRCLQPDPAERFQSAAEVASALGALDDQGVARAPARPARSVGLTLAGATVALVAVLAGGTWWMARARPPGLAPAAREPVSVLIADFQNRANDVVFEGSLEQPLAISMEGASFITAYPRVTAQRVAAQIRPGSRLDESAAKLVSIREGVKVVLAGSIAPSGSGYEIAVKAIDAAVDKPLATATVLARSKADVLQAIASVASKIRDALGDTTPETARFTASDAFTAGSLEAAHDFSVGLDLASAGDDEKAIEHFRQALARDPNFGRAYSAWGASAWKLGRTAESQEVYQKALSLLDRMTDREKYRTLGLYYLTATRNYEKAIENYNTLVKLYPADRAGHSNLALAHFYRLNFGKALEEARESVKIYPKNDTFRNNYALYAMYAGDFATAEREARRVIEQNPKFAKAYLPIAMAALAANNVAGARDAYGRMEGTGGFGASLAAMGLADLALYEGRWNDAEPLLTRGVANDEKSKSVSAGAAKYVALGELQAARGNAPLAIAAAQNALKLSRVDALVPAATVFVEAGRDADARALAAELRQSLQTHAAAYARIIEGRIALSRQQSVDAVGAFRAAADQADLWLGRFNLGRAYVEAGHFAEGLAELEICLKRRGEATAVFLDDIPSMRYLPPVYYWLGRAQEGLGIKTAAAESYKKFLAMRSAATDVMAADARRRVGGL